MARAFAVGEKVLILDSKKRRYLATLSDGGQFHSHSGVLEHNDIVGSQEGTVLKSTKGAHYSILRPTLEDFVLEMPRGAQVTTSVRTLQIELHQMCAHFLARKRSSAIQ